MKTHKIICNKFSSLMERLIRNLNLLDRDKRLCGVTMSQCYTLESLARNRRLNVRKLSQELGLTMSTMTRILDVLVRNKMVVRKRKPRDRRQVCIELAPKGKKIASKLKKCCGDYSTNVLNNIPIRKRKEIINSLEIFMNAIKSVDNKCCI